LGCVAGHLPHSHPRVGTPLAPPCLLHTHSRPPATPCAHVFRTRLRVQVTVGCLLCGPRACAAALLTATLPPPLLGVSAGPAVPRPRPQASGVPVKLLHEGEGHPVTVEMKSGEIYRGRLTDAEDSMNCQLSEVTVVARDGQISKLEHCYLRGSQIRFFVLPDLLKNAPMFKRVQKVKEARDEAAKAKKKGAFPAAFTFAWRRCFSPAASVWALRRAASSHTDTWA
jgi:small nuclear ribonucleoprotein D3